MNLLGRRSSCFERDARLSCIRLYVIGSLHVSVRDFLGRPTGPIEWKETAILEVWLQLLPVGPESVRHCVLI